MTEQVNRSIRADKAVFDKLKAICAEKGMQQGAALEAILTAWEVQEAKGLVPERAADVADFDAHLQGIQKAFLRSLDLAAGAEQRARVSFSAQLDAMSGSVARLEKELAETQAELAKATHQAAENAKRAERAEKRVAELEKAQSEQNRTEALLIALEARLTEGIGKDTAKPQKAARSKKSGKSAKAESAPDWERENKEEIEREEQTMNAESGNTIEFKAVKTENGIEYKAQA